MQPFEDLRKSKGVTPLFSSDLGYDLDMRLWYYFNVEDIPLTIMNIDTCIIDLVEINDIV